MSSANKGPFQTELMFVSSVTKCCGNDQEKTNAMVETHWALMAAGEVLKHNSDALGLPSSDERIIATTGLARLMLERLDCQRVMEQNNLAMQMMEASQDEQG